MKRYQLSDLVLGILALVTAGCAHDSLHPASEANTPSQKQLMEVIEFPRQTLNFKPTRDDISVGRVTFSVASSKPEEVRVNGARPDPAWMRIELKQVAKNQYELAPLKIEFPTNANTGIVCMSVKAWFNEVTTVYDSMFYQKVDDRYALVSWCTSPPESFPDTQYKARFGQNRVATVNEFKATLLRPFVLKLNQRPLREEWSR